MMSEEDMFAGSIQEVGSLEERLRQVASEIDNIKNSFTKGAENLSRIKNMLDLDAFKDVTATIQKFEGQISEIERQKEEAYQGAKKYSAELEKEKERLIKLWDAYKKQEEELSKVESKVHEYEERARNAETEKTRLDQDYTARINTLQQKINNMTTDTKKFDEYKQKINEYNTIYSNLEHENAKLKKEINNNTDTVNHLQQQVNKYKEYEQYGEYKNKFNDVNQAYEKEKERLTKLYHLYEETEHESKRLKQENDQWQNWFNSNRDIFDRLFSAAPPALTKTSVQPRHIPTTSTPNTMPLPHQEKMNKTVVPTAPAPQPPEKKKRKLFFRK